MEMLGAAYLVSLLAAAGSVPLISRWALSLGIVDRPGTRKIHSTAVPTIGGLAIVAAWLAAMAALLCWDNPAGAALRNMPLRTAVLFGAGGAVCLVGLVDDIRRLRARLKLLAQVAAALAVASLGLRIDTLAVSGLFQVDLGWLAWPVTILWIVGITNAVNLIDGLDGLAAGICAIACAVMAVFAFATGQLVLATMMVAVLGGLTGFLFFNFYPARVFLGDCGSMFLGFFLAVAAIVCAAGAHTAAGMALPVLALGVPIFDTIFSIIRRILDRRSLFAPDRGHIHHRLIDSGIGHRQAVLVLYSISLGAGLIGLMMLGTRGLARLGVFCCGLSLLVVAFRHFGAIRFREARAAFLHNRALARDARRRQRMFEEMQLRIREAKTLGQWWRVVRRAARYLGLSRLDVLVERDGGIAHELLWRLQGISTNGKVLRLSLPVRHGPPGQRATARIEIPVNGSLEVAGRGVMLFGRLIDERDLVELAPGLASAPEAAPRDKRLAQPTDVGLWIPRAEAEDVDFAWQRETD